MDSAYVFGTIIGALISGGIVGLIPFLYGRKKGYQTIGTVSLLLCMLGNFILGLFLSVPICIISVILLALKKENHPSGPYGTLEAGSNTSHGQEFSKNICPHCGKSIEPGIVYCINCGGKV